MKQIITGLVALVALTGAAAAADTYASQRGSTKDAPVDTTTFDPSGVYFGGFVGHATIDRSIRRDVQRELGLDVTIPQNATQQDIDDLAKLLSDNGVRSGGSQTPGGNFTIPLAGDLLTGATQDDLSTVVFGAEALYLRKLGSIGVSVGGGVTFYGDSDTRSNYSGVVGSNALGTVICPAVNTPAGCSNPSVLQGQSGFVSVERDFDVDLIARLHWFATDRFAINAGAGVSFARANIKAGNFADVGSVGGAINAHLPGLNTTIDEDDTSIAPVFTVGADYWATDRLKLGLAYEYKNHEFDAKGSNSASAPNVYATSNDSVKIEDDTHIVKLGVLLKLN